MILEKYSKSNSDRGGMVANVTFKNIEILDVYKSGILIQQNYGSSSGHFYPIFKNISIVNTTIITEKDATDGKFECYEQSPCTDIVLEDVNVTGGHGFVCENAYGTASNTSPKSCLEN